VVIVGIGSADFSQMQSLDDDVKGRDIVQFVPYNKYKNAPHLLAKETMCEIPGQCESYMQMARILPQNFA